MSEIDGFSKPPQIYEMFQKFAMRKKQGSLMGCPSETLPNRKEIGKSEVFEPNPFAEGSIKVADRALVSHLQRLSEFKRFYVDFCRNTEFDSGLPIGYYLEAQVEENQSKLQTLRTKDSEVVALRKKLDEIHKSNLKLSKRLFGNLGSSCDVLLSVKVFDSLLHDDCRLAHKKAGWDLDLAVNLVHPNIDYAKKAHCHYAFLSYVSLRIFWEHVSSNPLKLLNREPSCEFSKFCENKYQEIIHPKVCFLTIKAKVENGSIIYLLIFGGYFSVDDRNI
ncbi:hypothetical protein UlMin_022494 [Ulmus minor]